MYILYICDMDMCNIHRHYLHRGSAIQVSRASGDMLPNNLFGSSLKSYDFLPVDLTRANVTVCYRMSYVRMSVCRMSYFRMCPALSADAEPIW